VHLLYAGLVYTSIALQSVLLFLLFFRGHFRRYPVLAGYCAFVLAATVAEFLVQNALGNRGATFRYLYMTDEAILDLVLFLMVIGMTRQAMAENPLRAKFERFLRFTVIGTVVLPFVLFRGPVLGSRWFNETSQMLDFGAAIMNLVLWTALLGNKKRDPMLLAVSAGLGVAVTGAAITYGLLHFQWSAHGTARDVVILIKSFTNVVSLVIWCRAFWAVRPRQPVCAAPPVLATYP
jgi:hypothetical protein